MKGFIFGVITWIICASLALGKFSYGVLENLSLPKWVQLEIIVGFTSATILGILLCLLVKHRDSSNTLLKISLLTILTLIVYFLTGFLYTFYS